MTTALKAVDGVALKVMVDAWAVAPAAQKEAAFYAAFAVRQVEIGLASVLSLFRIIVAQWSQLCQSRVVRFREVASPASTPAATQSGARKAR